MKMSDFTHFNEQGRARMVDVGEKAPTRRVAVAAGRVLVNGETFGLLRSGGIRKGDVLTEDGLLIVVSSGKEHLLEMRQKIYDDVHLSDELPAVPDGFYEIARLNNRYVTAIPTTEALAALFTMTPFYYKTTEAGRERLFSADLPFSVTVDVNYSIFGVK